jgi:hypothetical protein
MDLKSLTTKIVDFPWGRIARSLRVTLVTLGILLPLVTLFLIYYYRVDTPETLSAVKAELITRDPSIDAFVGTLQEFAPPVSLNPADYQKKSIFE